MNIKEYKNVLKANMPAYGFNEEEIRSYLKYASTLFHNEMPIILDQEHFAQLVGYEYQYILGMSNANSAFYKEYKLPKRSGGFRIINEPLPDLKAIQDWMLDNILMKACRQKYISRVAKAFLPNKNIKDNAILHLRHKVLVCLDIHDFFGSIKRNKIFRLFENWGYRKSLCVLFSHLSTLDNVLPQGAPTSPMLSNLIFKPVDDSILAYCKAHGIIYSRYADDMTFSSDVIDVNSLINFVRNAIAKLGLKLNEQKTKVMNQGRAQTVTGILVNEKMQATKYYRRKIRQEVYYIKKYGLVGHMVTKKTNMKPEVYIRHLLGQILFVLFINPDDKEAIENKRYLNYLLVDYENAGTY